MRQPNHIVLDFEAAKSTHSSRYWAVDYLTTSTTSANFLMDLDVHRKYRSRLRFNKPSVLNTLPQKSTLKNSTQHPADFLKTWEREGLTKLFKPSPITTDESKKHVLRYSQAFGRDAYMYMNLPEPLYSQRNIKCLLLKYARTSEVNYPTPLNTWYTSLNVNFLRKERLYTKLKYSRSPAFDTVSGGAAALLAGFFGFLISEKFGYELVDSGDFYYLFMYGVFLTFSLRPLLIVSDASSGFWHALSLRRVFAFYVNLIKVLLNVFK